MFKHNMVYPIGCIIVVRCTLFNVSALIVADEFSYELVFDDVKAEEDINPAIALSLIRQQRDKDTGVVSLVFNIIYAPYKVMR